MTPVEELTSRLPLRGRHSLSDMPACPRCVLDALSLLDAEDRPGARRLLIQSVSLHIHLDLVPDDRPAATS